MPLLVEFYKEMPQPQEGEHPAFWNSRLHTGLAVFQTKVADRYSEATLQRLLAAPDAVTRRAAVLAIGLIGSMRSNKLLLGRLKDEDKAVRQLADEAMWAIWFRADSPAHTEELQRLRQLRDAKKALAGLNALIEKSPRFAEAYNQRAILHFRLEDYPKSSADCEKVLHLNPYHFGAQAGLAQCHLKLNKPKAALKAFRAALRLNPNLQGVEDTIRSLEEVLGEEPKDDKK